MMVHFLKRFSDIELNRLNKLIAAGGKAIVMQAVASLPDNDEPDDPDVGSGKQISLDDLVNPADWPEEVNWGTLSIDSLCSQLSILRKHKPRFDRGRARAAFLNVAKQKKPRRRKIQAAIRRQFDYLQRNLDAIDVLIIFGSMLSGLKTH